MAHEDCIFCKIIRGEIPCQRVYETDAVLGFLDIAPVRKGHTLVIPKDHHATVFDLPDAFGTDLLAALKVVGAGVMAATGAQGLNIGMNNHRAAGQLVDHAHVHLIPRFEDDGLTLWGQTSYDSDEEMRRMARQIAASIES